MRAIHGPWSVALLLLTAASCLPGDGDPPAGGASADLGSSPPCNR